MALRRRIQIVIGARAGEPRLVVARLDVVEQLILGRAPVDVVEFFAAAIEDAAVPGFANLPFDLEIEIAELVLRDEVLDGPVFGERPLLDAPAVWHGVALVAAPGVERRAVEQDLPARIVG